MKHAAVARRVGTAPIKRVAFRDLSVTDPLERKAILAAVGAVLDHGRVILGPEVGELERRIAEICNRRHGVGVGSGTDALILGLKALGIGAGDEVITTPLSWLATASSILLAGATPVFADIDETLTLDPATIAPLITPRTKAVLPVHFTGRLAQMPEICDLARRRGLLVIEDGAQAFGASFEGRPCGSFGEVACLSLGPMKVPGALGDAGIVLTGDDAIAERLRALRHSGVVDREYCRELSHNCRLDTVQAAVLLQRLPRHDAVIVRRREIAQRYDRELTGLVATPPRLPGYRDVYYTYTIRTPKRDGLRQHLERLGIETRIQHPVLLERQPAFEGKVRGRSPRAAGLVKEILCIPAHAQLTDDEQGFVIEAVRQYFGARP